MTVASIGYSGRCILCLTILSWLVSILAVPVLSQDRLKSKLAVDSMVLKDRTLLRGFVIGANREQEVSIAVALEWLRKNDLNLFVKSTETSKQTASRSRTQLRDRLKAFVPTEVFQSYDFFIGKELQRIESEIENPVQSETQFLILKFKANAIASTKISPDANRRIALWSWHERLLDVETRPASSLATELKSKDIDPDSQPPDLASRFPAIEESDDQWTARLALVSHRLAQPIEFQGSGAMMILVGAKENVSLAALLPQMLQLQMKSIVQDLTEGTHRSQPPSIMDQDWIKKSIAQSEAKEKNYFRATQLRLEGDGFKAMVESVFVVRLTSGKWSILWRSTSEQSASEQPDAAMKRIADDPQVKALRSALEFIGGSEAFDKAVRIGAATQAAQRIVNEQFDGNSQRYLRQLDYPPVYLQSH